jgi:hypothetical protein
MRRLQERRAAVRDWPPPTPHDRAVEIKLRDSRCAYNGFLVDPTPEEIAPRSTLA